MISKLRYGLSISILVVSSGFILTSYLSSPIRKEVIYQVHPAYKTRPFPYQKKHFIKFNGTLSGPDLIEINLGGLEGSQPKNFGYYMAIWQGTQIQELSRSLNKQNILLTTQDGSFVFKVKDGIADKDYILGLGVNNKDSTSFCSTLFIPKGTPLNQEINDRNAFSSSIEVVKLGTNSLVLKYQTPQFNLPQKNNNWIALFHGRFTSNVFLGINLIKKKSVQLNTNNGRLALNNIPNGLVTSHFYTLVYGMGYISDDAQDAQNIIAATEFLVPSR